MVDVVRDGEYLACVIRSEDDAWDLLRRAQAGEFDEPVIPTFDGWPKLAITFWKGDKHEALTAPMMEGLLSFQSSVYRSFMLVEEGTSNLRHLSDEQRRSYELLFQVEPGCTKLVPDLTDAATAFATAAVAHMDGQQVTIAIIVAVLSWASVSAWKAWLDAKAKTAQDETNSENIKAILETQRVASAGDVEKFALMTNALERAFGTKALLEASEEGKQGILRAASRVDATDIDDVEIEPRAAKRMYRAARTTPEQEAIEGIFRVVRNDPDYPEGYRVKLRSEEDEDLEFFATLRDAVIAPEDRTIVSTAEWDRVPFWARVAVTRNRGEIVKAEIVEVRAFDE